MPGGGYPFFGNAVAALGDVDGDGLGDFALGDLVADMVTVHSGVDGQLLYSILPVQTNGRFGSVFAGVGDIGGDSFGDILVGDASVTQGSSGSAGEVYVFSGASGAEIRRISGPSLFLAEFGRRVGSAGDVDQDGVPDLLVWSRKDLIQTDNYGVIQVFSGATSAELFYATGQETRSYFTLSAAGVGDVDGDCCDDIAIGDPRAISTGPQGTVTGKLTVYSGATQDALCQVISEVDTEEVGFSVVCAGDVDRDGLADVLIGIDGHNGGIAPNENKSALIVKGVLGVPIARFRYSHQNSFNFSRQVANFGDLDGDGIRISASMMRFFTTTVGVSCSSLSIQSWKLRLERFPSPQGDHGILPSTSHLQVPPILM